MTGQGLIFAEPDSSSRMQWSEGGIVKPSEAEERYISVLRQMSGDQRVKIGAELYEMARHIVESSIKNEHPTISEEKLRERANQRMQS